MEHIGKTGDMTSCQSSNYTLHTSRISKRRKAAILLIAFTFEGHYLCRVSTPTLFCAMVVAERSPSFHLPREAKTLSASRGLGPSIRRPSLLTPRLSATELLRASAVGARGAGFRHSLTLLASKTRAVISVYTSKLSAFLFSLVIQPFPQSRDYCYKE